VTWRVGRKLGRTLYRNDVCVGLVDTPGLALEIVEALNARAAAAAKPARESYPIPIPETEYLDTKQAAKLLGVSRKGLESLRARGDGPPYIRIGKAIRYPVATIAQKRK
jgi:predicted DNA-binding transcriptional regulator AlpA